MNWLQYHPHLLMQICLMTFFVGVALALAGYNVVIVLASVPAAIAILTAVGTHWAMGFWAIVGINATGLTSMEVGYLMFIGLGLIPDPE